MPGSLAYVHIRHVRCLEKKMKLGYLVKISFQGKEKNFPALLLAAIYYYYYYFVCILCWVVLLPETAILI